MDGPEDVRVRRSEFLVSTAASVAAVRARRSVLRLSALPAGHDVDPYRDAERGIDEIAWLYADGLVGWNGAPTPLLAARLPAIGDRGRRYRYDLREVRWHDGEPLRATDVVNAFAAVRRSFWGTYEPYRGVRAVVPTGERSFEVVLEQPNATFVRTFFGARARPSLPLLRSSPGSLPVGTGPFAVRERIESNRWRLEQAGDTVRGRARLDAIDLRYLFSRETEFVTLLTGETDVALPIPGRFPVSASFRRIRRSNGITLMLLNAEGPFGDFATRVALAGSLDVFLIQRGYDRHRASLLASFRLDRGNDPALARRLAPHPAAIGELSRRLSGHEVRLITLPGTSVDIVMGLVRQRLVNDAGVAVRMIRTPYDGLYGPTSPLRTGDFDLALNSYAYVDAADLRADWSCAMRAPAGGNFSRWCDHELDAAIAKGDAAAAFRRLYDRLAAIPMSEAYEDIGVAHRVCDVPAPAALVPATYTCSDWRIC
ncbi:MAG TPA: ABC transporter substrate-binding protein [Dongiaceae bacterium]|nr:ABC transporter substrate-binding protein [Dongiaceae bacterium]